MEISLHHLGVSLRAALASFSILIGLIGLFPEFVPVGFEAVAPDLAERSYLYLYVHFAGNTLLILSGLWLMFGICGRGSAVLCVSLLSFYVYLVRVDFAAPKVALVLYGVFCIVVLAIMFAYRLALDEDTPR